MKISDTICLMISSQLTIESNWLYNLHMLNNTVHRILCLWKYRFSVYQGRISKNPCPNYKIHYTIHFFLFFNPPKRCSDCLGVTPSDFRQNKPMVQYSAPQICGASDYYRHLVVTIQATYVSGVGLQGHNPRCLRNHLVEGSKQCQPMQALYLNSYTIFVILILCFLIKNKKALRLEQ